MDEEQVRQIAQDVYQNLGSRFGVNQVPTHVHNGVDSPALPQFNLLTAATGGAFGQQLTRGQIINANPVTGTGNTSNLNSVPIPIIYGSGSGSASAFNGGIAPYGTAVIFVLNSGIIQLWVRIYDVGAGADRWQGINFGGPIGTPALSAGSIA